MRGKAEETERGKNLDEGKDKRFLTDRLLRNISDVCHNCHREIIAWADAEGEVRYKCPYCHAVTTLKIISRRKVQIEVTAPKGQVIRYGYNPSDY